MKHLYLVHVGYYDPGLGNGLYENHANFLVAAESFEEARAQAKEMGLRHGHRVHIDGMICVEGVQGYRVQLTPDPELGNADRFVNNKDRELAPKTSNP